MDRKGDKLAIFSSTGNPTILGNETARRKRQNLDDFALVRSSIEFVNLGISVAADVVDGALRGEADLRSQLPVSFFSRVNTCIVYSKQRVGLHNVLDAESNTVVSARLLEDEGIGRMVTARHQYPGFGSLLIINSTFYYP